MSHDKIDMEAWKMEKIQILLSCVQQGLELPDSQDCSEEQIRCHK